MWKMVKRASLVVFAVMVLVALAQVPNGWGAFIVWSFLLYVVVRAWPNVKADFSRLTPNRLRGRHGGVWVGSRGGDTL